MCLVHCHVPFALSLHMAVHLTCVGYTQPFWSPPHFYGMRQSLLVPGRELPACEADVRVAACCCVQASASA